MSICGDDEKKLLRAMMLIRIFEEELMNRRDHGFQLLSSGQEAVAVGVCAALSKQDQLLTSGRSIGPALARGLTPASVMAELLGKVAGPNRGRAGRGHMALPSAGFFGAHAVVGGNLTIAAGVALAFHLERRPAVVVCLFGDGACGSGALHETLNLAALWHLPLLFVCDNNRISVSTPSEKALAPSPLSELAKPFGLPAITVDGMDVLAVRQAATELVAGARAGKGAGFLECLSERFSSHSTSTLESRAKEDVAALRLRCPIAALKQTLVVRGDLDEDGIAALEAEVRSAVKYAVNFADASDFPDPEEALFDVL